MISWSWYIDTKLRQQHKLQGCHVSPCSTRFTQTSRTCVPYNSVFHTSGLRSNACCGNVKAFGSMPTSCRGPIVDMKDVQYLQRSWWKQWRNGYQECQWVLWYAKMVWNKLQFCWPNEKKKTPNCSVLYIEQDKRRSIQQLKLVHHFDWFRYSVENLDVGLKARSSLLGVTFVSCFLFLGCSLDIWYDHVHAFINLPRFGVASCSIW